MSVSPYSLLTFHIFATKTVKLGCCCCVAQRIPRRIEFILIKDFKPNFPNTPSHIIMIWTSVVNSVGNVTNSCFPKFRNIVGVICLIGKLVILYDSERPTFSNIRMFQKVQLEWTQLFAPYSVKSSF